MDRGREDLLVMEQPRGAGGEAVLEPVLHEVADHLEIAWVEGPDGGVAGPETPQDLSLKGRLCGNAPLLQGRDLTARGSGDPTTALRALYRIRSTTPPTAFPDDTS